MISMLTPNLNYIKFSYFNIFRQLGPLLHLLFAVHMTVASVSSFFDVACFLNPFPIARCGRGGEIVGWLDDIIFLCQIHTIFAYN